MLNVVVLAAGKGTRMKSSLPKVLHPIAGQPMLGHVLDTVRRLDDYGTINVVVGHGADKVEQLLVAGDVRFILQKEQNGTGDAVAQALPHIQDNESVLILYGDVPLTKLTTLKGLVECVGDTSLGLLTLKLEDPTGYGRIERDAAGAVVAIVEQKDAGESQLKINEINTGIMAVTGRHLKSWLPKLSSNNAQGEYYLTDIIAMAKTDGVVINTKEPSNEWEVLGVNNRQQQAQLERYYQFELAQNLLANGLTLMDPARFDCRGSLEVGDDVVIDINCVFEGKVEIGDGVTIGPNCAIKNASIGEGTTIKANSIIEDSIIAKNCDIGPFARLRPGTELADGAKIGNFVETKKAFIGEGSKVNHLSYVGDAKVGKKANIGAGTITCNYDGANKFLTEIEDDVFVGSNTALVAPVKVGKGATIGAGSTITMAVPDHNLSVSRGKQKNIAGWDRPTKIS